MAQDKQTSERQPEVSEEIGEHDDVIVRGTLYADATRRKEFDSENVTNTTFTGKMFDFLTATMPEINGQIPNHNPSIFLVRVVKTKPLIHTYLIKIVHI